jgi:4-amino-4-deoxy-L-arabinose transferase-like glycosyltransferase
MVTARAVGALARRCAGGAAGLAAAAAISTFLLSFQVAIWLATDAPLLAAVSAALLGLDVGFYARDTRERLCGYTAMHVALALGFLCKSAAAWMVPALTLATLIVWERRWRELARWELYAGLIPQAAIVLTWVWAVYAGPDGPAHLKVFFWNNLVGRFAHVEAPDELQYAAAHRNSPGKYLIELPVYLWPWTLLVAAASRRAWRQRKIPGGSGRTVRFAIAVFVPTLAVLSLAATARNIYLAPALPGVALLLGWWVKDLMTAHDAWDGRAVRATAVLLATAALVLAAALVIAGRDGWELMHDHAVFIAVSSIGLAASLTCSAYAWTATRRGILTRALVGLLIAYCALLVGPASQLYARVDAWQDLGAIGRAMESDAEGRPMILFAPDETTRAFIDMYARTAVVLITGPATAKAAAERLRAELTLQPRSVVVTQLSGRNAGRTVRELSARLGLTRRLDNATRDADVLPAWTDGLGLTLVHRYALPNGRRYALLAREPPTAPR